MKNVSEIMSRPVVSVSGDTSLEDATTIMEDAGVRHLPVIEKERLVGILSERELLEATGWLPPRVLEVLEAPSGVVRDVMHTPVVTASPSESLVAAALRLVEWGVGCLPVLDDTKLVGILTDVDLLRVYADSCHGELISVRSDPEVERVMTTDVTTAGPETPGEEALEFLRSNAFRHLPIVEGERLVGILSERDLKLSAGRGQLEGTAVVELCAEDPYTISAGAPLSEGARTMVARAISALPVVDQDRLLGILTSTDLLRHCVDAFSTGTVPPDAGPG